MFGPRKRRRHPAKELPNSIPTHGVYTRSAIELSHPTLSLSPYSPFAPPRLASAQPPRRSNVLSDKNVNASPLEPSNKSAAKKHPPLVMQRVKRGGEASKEVPQKLLNAPLHPARKPPDLHHHRSEEHVPQGALSELISSKLDDVLTAIDGETFRGDEEELLVREEPQISLRGGWGSGSRSKELSRGANKAISTAIVSTNYFSKANLYANSKLPPALPPLQLYLPSYPLLCLAAQYSLRAYNKPSGNEREAFVNADWRMGTKAMVIKSVPIDDMNCIVFAIRGSQTFMDWAVNLNSAPLSPSNFLDDPGNLCHSGFLSVARKMIKPVAARLRSMLEENPSRSTCSLLMTGHSAGGAVASLLYSHMLSEIVRSELNILTGCFKRIHCLTFGTPPVSLLPLTKPNTLRHKRSLFMSFINEGDPVPRADKAYIRSLLRLYAAPAPGSSCNISLPVMKPCKKSKSKKEPPATIESATAPIWHVPPGTLSNAGRLVVLRDNKNVTGDASIEDVKAGITCDQELRSVVFGDPVMHMMKVYAKRVEILATKAVTAKVSG